MMCLKKSDLDISKLARELELDIGVDLKGHTTDCRPKIFAYGVAPIQMSYLGLQELWVIKILIISLVISL